MDNIKAKIAKLLALAGNNPSEDEAKAAILKARALMVKHKLRPEECEAEREEKVVKDEAGITCTARKYAWALELSRIIAEHYCCISGTRHYKRAQKRSIFFIGLKSDFEICSRIFRYAFDCVKSASDELFEEDAERAESATRRKRAEAYGFAFCEGLEEALNKQKEENREWGIVLAVPPQVHEVSAGMGHFSFNAVNFDDDTVGAYTRGYYDGKKFDPSTKLEGGAGNG